jgi:hypothetical protein
MGKAFFEWNRFPASLVVMMNKNERGRQELVMARIVIRCQYTGHYVFTGFDTQASPAVTGGRIFCPYCVAEHVWSSAEARLDEPQRERRQKPQVRQAS